MVIDASGRVLLIRRSKEPLRGRWLVPGGSVELGETLEEAVVREVREETGLEVRPVDWLGVFDRIEREGESVLYHFVIVDYLCALLGGELRAASDALEACWARPGDLAGLEVPEAAVEVIERGFRRKGLQWGTGPG